MKKKIISILVLLVISITIIVLVYPKNTKISKDFFNKMESESFSITEYYIYGQYLTMKGSLNFNEIDEIKDVNLLLKNNQNEIVLEIDYSIGDNLINFSTKGSMNNGIYLDNIKIGDYYLILEVTTNNKTFIFGGLNKTNYDNSIYYTLTKNSSNNKILIGTDNINEKDYMSFKITEETLPENIYDILIDPGHGSIDPGNTMQDISEKEQVLEMAKKIKIQLENKGYKVLLTRDGDFNPGHVSFTRKDGSINYIDPYGEGGRIALAYESGAKYTFSIHTNSEFPSKGNNGLEVYTPKNINYDLANSIANGIISKTGLNCSPNQYYKVSDCIYTRLLSKSDIESQKKYAQNKGYIVYDLSDSTLYNYIIRETGGYMTGAYVDGRNPNNDENPYRKLNKATETYLLEMAYSSVDKDYEIISKKKDEIALGLVEGFTNYISTK